MNTMSKRGFTPGPWEITGATEIVKFGEDWACIAVVSNPRPTKNPEDSTARPENASLHNPRFDEACANARLISAAPELYEACAEFVRKCESGEACSTRSYAQMKAAITKAEGTPPLSVSQEKTK